MYRAGQAKPETPSPCSSGCWCLCTLHVRLGGSPGPKDAGRPLSGSSGSSAPRGPGSGPNPPYVSVPRRCCSSEARPSRWESRQGNWSRAFGAARRPLKQGLFPKWRHSRKNGKSSEQPSLNQTPCLSAPRTTFPWQRGFLGRLHLTLGQQKQPRHGKSLLDPLWLLPPPPRDGLPGAAGAGRATLTPLHPAIARLSLRFPSPPRGNAQKRARNA